MVRLTLARQLQRPTTAHSELCRLTTSHIPTDDLIFGTEPIFGIVTVLTPALLKQLVRSGANLILQRRAGAGSFGGTLDLLRH